MKDLLFRGGTLFFLEHDPHVHSGIIQKIIADFYCNQHLEINFRKSIDLSLSNFLKSLYLTTFGGSLRKCVFKTETVIL